MTGLNLVTLTPDDAQGYYHLVYRNRDRLTRHGDYSDLKHATLESVVSELREAKNENARFGIWLNDRLIGRADLSPRAPGHLVIGYWLGSEYTGRGYTTIACTTLIHYGRNNLGATDIYAGMTKGNEYDE